MEVGSVHPDQAIPAAAQLLPAEDKAEARELIKAVKALNATELFGQNSELTFVVDRESRRPLVRIVDRETREVIRQFPPEYALRMAEDLKKHR